MVNITYKEELGLLINGDVWIPKHKIITSVKCLGLKDNLVYSYRYLSILFIEGNMFICKHVYNCFTSEKTIVIGHGWIGICVSSEYYKSLETTTITDWVPFPQWDNIAHKSWYKLFHAKYSFVW